MDMEGCRNGTHTLSDGMLAGCPTDRRSTATQNQERKRDGLLNGEEAAGAKGAAVVLVQNQSSPGPHALAASVTPGQRHYRKG